MTLFARRDGSPESPRYPLTSSRLLEWFGGGGRYSTAAGANVTPSGALAMSAVYRCVGLVAGIGGELPMRTFKRGTFEIVPSRLLESPHPFLTSYDLWRLEFTHRALWGNSYLQKVRDGAGAVRELWPIRPDRVKPGRADPSDLNPSGMVYEITKDDGTKVGLTGREIMHTMHLGFDGVMGLSPVGLAKQAIGMGLAAEEYAAKLFGSGNLLSGFIKTDAQLKKDQAERLQQQWRDRMLGRHNQHDIAILDAGAEFQQLTMPNDDAQFLEMRHFEVTEIGRWFGVPPFLLYETEKSTSWGTGLEQQATGFTMFDLGPQWLTPLEQRVTKELTPANVEVRYQRHKLLRGDSAARAAYYTVMREWGGFSADEVRAEEDMPPVDGGDLRLQPMNYTKLGADPVELQREQAEADRQAAKDAADAKAAADADAAAAKAKADADAAKNAPQADPKAAPKAAPKTDPKKTPAGGS